MKFNCRSDKFRVSNVAAQSITCCRTEDHMLQLRVSHVTAQRYHMLQLWVSHVTTQSITCYSCGYHMLQLRVSHVTAQSITCYNSEYHTLQLRISHVKAQSITCYSSEYHMLQVAFFKRWWEEQTNLMKTNVRQLVKSNTTFNNF